MTAVRRVLALAGVAALLALGSTGSAWADPTPSADPSATATPAASPDPSASPAATDAPSPEPTGSGCDQNPEICQSGGVPNTTTDCGQIGPGGEPASPPPPGTVCIASGLNPGTTAGGGAGAGAPRLPRTGPAPVLPMSLLGSGLLLTGVLVVLISRRRAARG